MKLVKIEDFYVNPDTIEVIDENGGEVHFNMRSSNSVPTNWPIEKVLQAISGSQEHSVKSNDGKDTYSKEYITSSNLMVKDDAKRYSFHNKNINASLVANNTEATISLCANDGVKNLLLKRDYSTAKDDTKIKKVNADNIKSGEISISFDSNGTAIINAKKNKT